MIMLWAPRDEAQSRHRLLRGSHLAEFACRCRCRLSALEAEQLKVICAPGLQNLASLTSL